MGRGEIEEHVPELLLLGREGLVAGGPLAAECPGALGLGLLLLRLLCGLLLLGLVRGLGRGGLLADHQVGLAGDGEGPLRGRHLDDLLGGLLLPEPVDGVGVEAVLLLPALLAVLPVAALAPALSVLSAVPAPLVVLGLLGGLLAVLLVAGLLVGVLVAGHGEPVHLHVLVPGHLVPEALDDLLGGELLDLVGARRAGDEVDLGDLEELPEDQLSAPVAVDEGGGDPLAGELLDGLGDAGPLDGDGVLDAGLEEVEDVGAALDDDDGLGVLHVGSGRAPVLAVGGDLLDLDALPDAVGEVDAGALGLLDELVEELLGTLDDLLPLGDPHVLDSQDVDGGLAGSDAVDGLEGGCEDDGLHLVQAGGHVDDPLGLAALGCDLDLDPADAAGFLKVPEVELVAEESLGLSEDRPDHVGFLDDAVGVDLRFHHILSCTWIDIHQHPPGGVMSEKTRCPCSVPTPSAQGLARRVPSAGVRPIPGASDDSECEQGCQVQSLDAVLLHP